MAMRPIGQNGVDFLYHRRGSIGERCVAAGLGNLFLETGGDQKIWHLGFIRNVLLNVKRLSIDKQPITEAV